MLINKADIRVQLIAIVFFLAFGGYYVVLILLSNLLPDVFTRSVTIPLRVAIVSLLIVIFLLYPRLRHESALRFFLAFAIVYLSRIGYEWSSGSSNFHMDPSDFMFYFVSFVALPLLLTTQTRFSSNEYERILSAILFGAWLTSLLTIVFYRDFIGTEYRLSALVGRDSNYISPLALSYVSVLGIALGLSYIAMKPLDLRKNILVSLVVIFCLIPFFLGASRGSLLALLVSLCFYFAFAPGIKRRATLVILLFAFTGTLVVAEQYLGSVVFTRFFGIADDIAAEGSSTYRLTIWLNSWEQFRESPFLGDSLECTFIGLHPHNMLIEVMITTGIVGTMPFLMFLIAVFHKCYYITVHSPDNYWIVATFFVGFTQSMVSGGIYAASWFAIGSGLVLGFRRDVAARPYVNPQRLVGM